MHGAWLHIQIHNPGYTHPCTEGEKIQSTIVKSKFVLISLLGIRFVAQDYGMLLTSKYSTAHIKHSSTSRDDCACRKEFHVEPLTAFFAQCLPSAVFRNLLYANIM